MLNLSIKNLLPILGRSFILIIDQHLSGCTNQCGQLRRSSEWVTVMEELTKVRKELGHGSGSQIPEVIRGMDLCKFYLEDHPPHTQFVNDVHCDELDDLEMLELAMAHRILDGANDMLKNRVAIDAIIKTVANCSTRAKTGIIAPESEWYRLVHLIKHEAVLPQPDATITSFPGTTTTIRSDKQSVYVMGLEQSFNDCSNKWLEAQGHDIIVLLVPPIEDKCGVTDLAKKEVLMRTMVRLDSGYAYTNGSNIIRLTEVMKPKVIVIATKVVSAGQSDITWIDANSLSFRKTARPGAQFEVEMNVSTTAHASRVKRPIYPRSEPKLCA